MSDLADATEFDEYKSHPNKLLNVHTDGVVRRVKARTNLAFVQVAAQLHDVGKINLYFQRKLEPNYQNLSQNYSNHSYLSALTFLAIPRSNLQQSLGLSRPRTFAVAVLIALHHGSLRNCYHSPNDSESIKIEIGKVLSEKEYEKASQFVSAHPELPFMKFAALRLGLILPYDIKPAKHPKIFPILLKECDALCFFLETQFGFATLVESDKRDAGDNDREWREEAITELTTQLAIGLAKPIATEKDPSEKTTELNVVRAQIRSEALQNISEALKKDEARIFCLTAPTGAGKTLTLLAVANSIIQHRQTCASDAPVLKGILYCLPFLSITEQIEADCRNLVTDENLILRADSSAHHPKTEKLLCKADGGDLEATEQLLREDFAEQIFDCPLVVTTFVQFFETLMSNRNATLLKLPNFARSVIIVDEIQALPPRLYAFFAAYLDAFCRNFDSYVIFSTATMPHFSLPDKRRSNAQSVFHEYSEPVELVTQQYFQNPCFQRYTVEPRWDISSLPALTEVLQQEFRSGQETKNQNSILVVLNTIADTRKLYRLLNPNDDPDILLLNTRFTPEDRRKTIDRCRNLDPKSPLILITTQLIEAGVNIDFPIVYRDLCPFPSLVQTAGRCNRHNAHSVPGRVVLIDIREHGRSRAEYVYVTDMDDWYLNFTRDRITTVLGESDLFDLQGAFFEKVNTNLKIGDHPKLRSEGSARPSNLINCICDAAFEDTGRFRLIQEEGEQYAFYIPIGANDEAFERLQTLTGDLANAKHNREFALVHRARLKVEAHLRQMRQRVVQARMKENEVRGLSSNDPEMGIYNLEDQSNYTVAYGLDVSGDASLEAGK